MKLLTSICLVFVSTLVYNAALVSSAAERPTPNVDELFDNWQSWAQNLDSIHPRHTKTRMVAPPLLNDYGYDYQVLETLIDRNRFVVYDKEYGPDSGSENPRFSLTFYRHDLEPAENGYVLVRKASSAPWYIQQKVGYKIDDLKDDFDCMYFIPGSDKNWNASLQDLYEVTSVTELSNEDTLVFDFVIKAPVGEISIQDYGSRKATQFRVWFERELEFLPKQMLIDYSDGISFLYSFKDWKPFEKTSIPHRLELRTPDEQAPVCLSLELEHFSSCTSEEVEERCRMSYYGLPDLTMPLPEHGGISRWLWILPLGLCFVGWLFVKRKTS